MAGGQGTRLGHNGPKGTFIMPIDSQKSIFELLCDHLKDAVEKYNTFVPWYIMTSEENHDETLDFLKETIILIIQEIIYNFSNKENYLCLEKMVKYY